MWKIIKSVWYLFTLAGGLTLWLSTNSVPKAVKDADGFLATNFQHVGWNDPPKAIATTAADNIGIMVGILLLTFSIICLGAWLWDKSGKPWWRIFMGQGNDDEGEGRTKGSITTGLHSPIFNGTLNGDVKLFSLNPTPSTTQNRGAVLIEGSENVTIASIHAPGFKNVLDVKNSKLIGIGEVSNDPTYRKRTKSPRAPKRR